MHFPLRKIERIYSSNISKTLTFEHRQLVLYNYERCFLSTRDWISWPAYFRFSVLPARMGQADTHQLTKDRKIVLFTHFCPRHFRLRVVSNWERATDTRHARFRGHTTALRVRLYFVCCSPTKIWDDLVLRYATADDPFFDRAQQDGS